MVRFADVEVGTSIGSADYPLARLDLLHYAGASGDFNVIHWNERIATAVGLPNVIAHGMLTMAEAGRLVTDWVGDPAAVVEFSVRFTRPVVVPDDDRGTLLTVSGKVSAKAEDGTVTVELRATVNDATVLGKAYAVVRLA